MNKKNQAELLDIYFDMLLQNPMAQPPAGLDAETAQMARQLADVEYHAPSLTESEKRHIWQEGMSPDMPANTTLQRRQNLMFNNKSMSIPPMTVIPSRRISWLAMVAVLSLVLFGGVFLSTINLDSGNPTIGGNRGAQNNTSPTVPNHLGTTSTMDIYPWDGENRLTILVMGIDSRPFEPRTCHPDVMMLLTLEPSTGEIGLLSIPRDAYVEVPNHGLQRINTACLLGSLENADNGPLLAMQTIQYNFGIRVNDYVIVDFEAFSTLIDEIGGIDVNVVETIDDPMYPDMTNGHEPFYLEEGSQHLDGETALKYVRSRHASDDFDRQRRQQEVMLAFRQQALDTNQWEDFALRVPSLWAELDDNIETSLSLEQALALILLTRNIEDENITSYLLDWDYFTPYTTDTGASVLMLNHAKADELMATIFGEDFPVTGGDNLQAGTDATPTITPSVTATFTATPNLILTQDALVTQTVDALTLTNTPTVTATFTPTHNATQTLEAAMTNTIESFQNSLTVTADAMTETAIINEPLPSSLNLPDYQNEPMSLSLDIPHANTLTSEQPLYIYSYNAKAGDILRVDIVTTSLVQFSYYSVSRPVVGNTDSPVVESVSSNGGTVEMSTPLKIATTIEVKDDSIIWLAIEKYPDAETVDYELTLSQTPIETLAYGDTISFTYPTDIIDQLYEFEGNWGDIVNISTSSEYDTILYLENSRGDILAGNDDGGSHYNAELYGIQLPATDVYRIRVRTRSFNFDVDVDIANDLIELSLAQQTPSLISADKELLLTLSTKSPATIVQFTGQAGETVELSSTLYNLPAFVSIQVMQNGEELASLEFLPDMNSSTGTSSSSGAGGGSADGSGLAETSRTFTVPTDGEVYIYVNFQPTQPAYQDELGILYDDIVELSLMITQQ